MSEVEELLSGTGLAERAALALTVPMAAALGVRLLDESDPPAGAWFEVGDGVSGNGAGGLHAAALGAVVELAAYLALLPQLHRDEHAVTHAVSTQLFAAVRRGERVDVRGTADARTGRLGFVGVVSTGPRGPVARSLITKSVVRFRS